jgi:hypothetical protein
VEVAFLAGITDEWFIGMVGGRFETRCLLFYGKIDICDVARFARLDEERMANEIPVLKPTILPIHLYLIVKYLSIRELFYGSVAVVFAAVGRIIDEVRSLIVPTGTHKAALSKVLADRLISRYRAGNCPFGDPRKM